MKTLTIYGQESPHDDVYIVGNSESLKSLADYINKTLVENCEKSGTFCVHGDGEGFKIIIKRTDKDNRVDDRERAVPYASLRHKERNSNVLWPWDKL